MLPQQLPFDLLSTIPWDSPATWVFLGIASALAALIVVKKVRRLVLLATILGVAGIVAWNAGVLPPAS